MWSCNDIHARLFSVVVQGVCYWSTTIALNEHERGPLSYIAGYVLFTLRKKSVQKKNDELQTILQSMICPDVENFYIESRSRAGL
jgi:hypothetical protein